MTEIEKLIAKHPDYWLGRLHENMYDATVVIKELELYIKLLGSH